VAGAGRSRQVRRPRREPGRGAPGPVRGAHLHRPDPGRRGPGHAAGGRRAARLGPARGASVGGDPVRGRGGQALVAWTLLLLVGGITAAAVWGDLDEQRAGEELTWAAPWALLLLLGCALVAW